MRLTARRSSWRSRARGTRWLLCVCIYIYIYNVFISLSIYIYIYTHIYTYIHSYIHTFIHSFIHTYIHTYVHTYIHTYMHTHIHTDSIMTSICVRLHACQSITMTQCRAFLRGGSVDMGFCILWLRFGAVAKPPLHKPPLECAWLAVRCESQYSGRCQEEEMDLIAKREYDILRKVLRAAPVLLSALSARVMPRQKEDWRIARRLVRYSQPNQTRHDRWAK